MAFLDFSRAPHGGRVALLPDNATAPRIIPRLLIDHSMVGSFDGTRRYFERGTNLESTLAVRLNGYCEQWMDTERRADANYRANDFAISVETEDRGDPDTQPWTAAQLDTLAWIAWECHRLHPQIPLRRASRWDGSGLGFHTMFGAPGPWTPVAKTCPGRVRIRQFNDVLLPRIIRGPEGDDMPDQAYFDAKFAALNNLISRIGDLVYNGRDFVTKRDIPNNVSLAALRQILVGPTNPPADAPSLRELITDLAANPPGGEVVVVELTTEQAAALTQNVVAAVERGLEGINVALDPADREAIVTGVNAAVLAGLARAGQAAASAVETPAEAEPRDPTA